MSTTTTQVGEVEPKYDFEEEISNATTDVSSLGSDSLAELFYEAVTETHSDENPSKVWREGLYESFLNVAEEEGVANPIQKWRGISGPAFEKFAVRYLNESLGDQFRIERVSSSDAALVLSEITPLENSVGQVDALVYGEHEGEEYVMGGVLITTSFHGRLRNAVEPAQELRSRNLSPMLVTLDSHREGSELTGESATQSEIDIVNSNLFMGVYSMNTDVQTRSVSNIGQSTEKFVADIRDDWMEIENILGWVESIRQD